MADYRQIHTHIWKDGWFLELGTDEKVLFIYLFSNERASIAGIYELSPRVMSFETGLSVKEVQAALTKFGKAGKVHYADGIVWVVNLRRYNENASPKVVVRIRKDLEAIPDCELKNRYLAHYATQSSGIHTVSIPHSELSSEQEQEQEQEIEQEQETTTGANPAPEAPESDPVKLLAVTFEQASGIRRPLPARENKKAITQVGILWWNPLREMVRIANGSAAATLTKAVEQMRRDHLTIAAPNSILKVFTSLNGERVGVTAKPFEMTPLQIQQRDQLREFKAKQKGENANPV